jgi:hypothetical protein
MYPIALTAGLSVLLLALLGSLIAIVLPRVPRPRQPSPEPTPPPPVFNEEFIGELHRLNHIPVPVTEAEIEPDAYTLHRNGEPVFRIASRLGIGKADADLLIRIEDSLRRDAAREPEN